MPKLYVNHLVNYRVSTPATPLRVVGRRLTGAELCMPPPGEAGSDNNGC
ncbi:hypothetical protein IG631_06970 [Alternaria alternata]|nr:hypothetical protein IG631_06970 [Alternaria alternata]